MKKRVFLIVLDSFGVGEAPDAARFGDTGANTLRSVSKSGELRVEKLKKLGLFNIDGVDFIENEKNPSGVYGRLREKSAGKDTTVGHWEIAGYVSEKPFPVYPHGFPDDIIEAFSRATGRGVLCNRPYSGTQVIADYGAEHLKTGKLIVYTSADSVFQIAAHEDIVPPEELYEYCRAARKILTGKNGVGRVIARPFTGDEKNGFTRTPRRHDFSLEPPAPVLPDYVKAAGLDSIAVGKIFDIFARRGFTENVFTSGNAQGEEYLLGYLRKDFHGLCFVNLVDFDMLYGHRNDVDGYARALTHFDRTLGEMLPLVTEDDLLIITADHGCDPGFTQSTDHTREYVPLIVYSKGIKPGNLGTKAGFSQIGKTVCDVLGVENDINAESFAGEIYGE